MLRHNLIHAAVAFGPSLLFVILFPLLMGASITAGRRRRTAQRARIEAYRASEESHILKLN